MFKLYGFVMEKSSAPKPSGMFPERLKFAREMRKMNQEQLAEAARLQSSAISHFETGKRKPSFDNLKKLADALGVTTDYLLGRTTDPEGHGAPSDPLYRDFQKLDQDGRDVARRVIRQFLPKNDD